MQKRQISRFFALPAIHVLIDLRQILRTEWYYASMMKNSKMRDDKLHKNAHWQLSYSDFLHYMSNYTMNI